MCGRTACTLAPDEVRRASRYRDRSGKQRRPQWRDGDADKYRPSYNKSPQSFSPVLLSSRHFNKDTAADECVLATMRWGLVPAWFKENDPSKMQYSTSNCRSESLLEKKSYKDPLLKGQRCVILADGFYEWRRQQKDKQPFFIYFPQNHADQQERKMKNEKECEEETGETEEVGEWAGWRLLTMAGLFDCWTPPGGGEVLYTYTVITVSASPNLQSIHDRMPAILDGEEEVRRWLDFGEVRSLEALKLLQSKSCLTFHPVSPIVNNARNNFPECLQPLDPTAKKSKNKSKILKKIVAAIAPLRGTPKLYYQCEVVEDRFTSIARLSTATRHKVVTLQQQGLSQTKISEQTGGSIRRSIMKWSTLRIVDAMVGQGYLVQQMKDTSKLLPFEIRCPAVSSAQNWQKPVGPRFTHLLPGEVFPEVAFMKELQPKSHTADVETSPGNSSMHENTETEVQKNMAPPQASASSKMMMSWLKNGSPSKRNTPDDAEPKETEEKPPAGKQKLKAAGSLQQWLLGNSSKKPRT